MSLQVWWAHSVVLALLPFLRCTQITGPKSLLDHIISLHLRSSTAQWDPIAPAHSGAVDVACFRHSMNT